MAGTSAELDDGRDMQARLMRRYLNECCSGKLVEWLPKRSQVAHVCIGSSTTSANKSP